DLNDSANSRRRRHGTDVRECLATLKERLEPYGFADAIALFPLNDKPLPRDLVEGCLDLDAAAEADLLLNLWHSLPASVVRRFQLTAFVDTDPGLLQPPVTLEQAIWLGRHYEEWRARLETLGWKIRDAWDVSATPEQYRSYIQRSRGEFSCAKPAYVKLATGWVSDRTACYLASGKPAV